MNIPEGTIRSWAYREQGLVVRASGVELAVEEDGRALPWAQRHGEIVEKMGGLVAVAVERVRAAFEEDRLRDARDGAVALGILCDKAELLSGRATTRSESWSVSMSATDIAARIRELEEELGVPPRGEVS